MDDTPIIRPTPAYTLVTWIVAAVVGVIAGLALGFLTQSVVVGIIVGVFAAVVIGCAVLLAARRAGHGSVDAAPPWTGDAGVRQDGGAI